MAEGTYEIKLTNLTIEAVIVAFSKGFSGRVKVHSR